MSDALLTVRDLAVSFDNRGGPRAQAVDGVSMTLHRNQTLAVVGESGCGKSVTALTCLRLLPTPPARVDRGEAVLNDGEGPPVDLLGCSEHQMRRVRGGRIAMIFQEPMSCLNPVFTIGDQLAEAITLHQRVGRREAMARAAAALEEVGVARARERLGAYPHEFSGGMRQRVMIAMALACEPSVLLADEPTTALDVTIQAQILELLREIQAARGMGILLITHALGVVAENADVVCVMYAGRVVEYARVEAIFERPLHPYTEGLLGCIPRLRSRAERLQTIRELTGRDEAWAARGGLIPWWPWREAPEGVVRDGGPDSALVEAEPGHWVGVWRTESAIAGSDRAPDLAPAGQPA